MPELAELLLLVKIAIGLQALTLIVFVGFGLGMLSRDQRREPVFARLDKWLRSDGAVRWVREVHKEQRRDN